MLIHSPRSGLIPIDISRLRFGGESPFYGVQYHGDDTDPSIFQL